MSLIMFSFHQADFGIAAGDFKNSFVYPLLRII